MNGFRVQHPDAAVAVTHIDATARRVIPCVISIEAKIQGRNKLIRFAVRYSHFAVRSVRDEDFI